MGTLILGVLVFLGVHALRAVAPAARDRLLGRLGEGPYKALYGLVAIAGLVLIVMGYGAARSTPTVLWTPPVWTRHLAGLLMVPAMILLAAAYVPGNRLRARFGHPMVLGVKTWAVAHLLANGTLADVILFGSFLVWGVVVYIRSRRRDRAQGRTYPAVGPGRDVAAVAAGLLLWVALAFWLHAVLFGVRPFG